MTDSSQPDAPHQISPTPSDADGALRTEGPDPDPGKQPYEHRRPYRNRISPMTKQRARTHRRNLTPTERVLWARVRRKRLGCRFHRQALIYGWIVDFWCPFFSLVVEVDGAHHATPPQSERDRFRDSVLRRNGIRTLRLPNTLVLKHMNLAVLLILSAFTDEEFPPSPSGR